ncbi:hypothetical protein NQ314_006635 [Rhamnusium bicolor]|uniref:WW domain-containing protein n=1 Tax=Rhamnusium bicolor TaxID=1586634 RepID=A0AAV8Z134_9CUCU|nr:hypothetical protein NQ314_006635 [Rhamnusium bicolor]
MAPARDASSALDLRKIELISSFGNESDSDDTEEPDNKLRKNVSNRKFSDSNVSDEDDDLDILTKIQRRAKELKELGGDLPPEVTNIVNQPKTEIKKSANISTKEKKKSIAGFSLVAGYSDSEEEQENEEVKSIFPIAPELPKVSHSRLFPITKPIDVKDFMQPAALENKPTSPTNDFDSKVFQRKKRIGVALINTGKKKGDVPTDPESDRKGFGFGIQDANLNSKDNIYAGFKKGGVMFVKSDVLNPTLPKDEVKTFINDDSKIEETISIKREEIEDMYATIKEKLGFLSEGRPQVSAVQVMVIQAETLFMAMKDGGLKLSYLQKWLNETCSDLIKLEKEAAPEGWLLQWDRSNKRYYYQNQATGESQWEYPQPDISRCDEAMDISTTPPPIEPTIHMSPPLPPTIRSPTPPPPPIISVECDSSTNNILPDVPLPSEPAAPSKFEKETKPADPLYSALDSFYSDIAAIENTNSNSPPPPPPPAEENKAVIEAPIELAKKKRKQRNCTILRYYLERVKLAPGLSMKKKGVSQLVEKWKSVQQHYND